eukprot:6273482-Pyramimonas_sp.AAC.1
MGCLQSIDVSDLLDDCRFGGLTVEDVAQAFNESHDAARHCAAVYFTVGPASLNAPAPPRGPGEKGSGNRLRRDMLSEKARGGKGERDRMPSWLK